jgi:alkylation response protein AidB-like acyl-CoA dehydrogenase
MNFDFDEQQVELHSTVARALADALPFETHEMRGSDDSAAWDIVAKLGLFGLLVPEAHGGLGLSLVDLALIAEELGTRLAPQSIIDTLVAADVIAQHASDRQRGDWLAALASGGLRVALAWHEAGAGYEPSRMTTTFRDGVLSGEKILVAHAAAADWLLVPFRHGDSVRTGLAMVWAGAKGVTRARSESLDPSCDHHRVLFNQVAIAPEAILDGRAPQDAAARLFDVAAALFSAAALGIAGEMVRRSADYARERVQFDKPIGSFQAIKHKCADMYTQVEAARAAAYYAVCVLSEMGEDGPRGASIAKAFCVDTAVECCHQGIQVHGGMGFTWELGLHHFLRRARILAASFGDSDFHRERVIAATLDQAALAAEDARSAA